MGTDKKNKEGVQADMRENDYNNLEEFTSQYTGEWSPSEGHWFGLDFTYKGVDYRLHTSYINEGESSTLPDGREVLFGLYLYKDRKHILLEQFGSMDELLDSTVIEGTPFRKVIMADDTIITGQD